MIKEETRKQIQEMRLIDDAFFEVFANNKKAVEEILRVILSDDGLTVVDVITQRSERNLFGRSIRLDALCYLGSGTLCNIEIQRFDNDDHFRRARFNSSMLTVRSSNPGESFADVSDVIVIYISEGDFLKGNKTIYHVEKRLRETNEIFDDGLYEIFVNTAVDDGSTVADLMSCFVKKEFDNPSFPETTAEVKRLKQTEGGLTEVSAISEVIREEGRKQGLEEGKRQTLTAMSRLVSSGLITAAQAADSLNITIEEFNRQLREYTDAD